MERKNTLFIIVIAILSALRIGASQRLLLAGDYPDPSILRDGKDFYMTHSPFYYAPGFLIWHSTNLIDWEPVCRACPEYEGSAMAPDLVKHNGKYFIYYPAMGGNYVITADSITGPWSKPVRLDISGIDPGHVVGEDGKRYLFTNNGWVAQLSDDGLSVVGKKRKVYDGWEYPKDWVTEGNDMYLESPKLIYKDGYYYMTSAEGGTAGPATSHMAVTARAKSIFGPWENSPYNPVIHTYSDSEYWWSKGHGTLFDDADGNWWMVYHAYEKGFHTLGRQTLLERMEFTPDGWFKAATDGGNHTFTAAPQLRLSDDFNGKSLGLQWTFWKEYAPTALGFDGESMTVGAKGDSPATGRLLLTTACDRSYEIETEITVDRANAGMLLFYSEKAYTGVTSDGNSFTIHLPDGTSKTAGIEAARSFKVRLLNNSNSLSVKVCTGGSRWITIASDIDVSEMHHNRYFGFFALRPALVTFGHGKASFGSFIYNGWQQTQR